MEESKSSDPTVTSPVIGVVKPMAQIQSNTSESAPPPQIINPEQLLQLAQQMGDKENISALTEAISNLNMTLLKAVQESLAKNNQHQQPTKVEQEVRTTFSQNVEVNGQSVGEDDFKDALDDGNFLEPASLGGRVDKAATAALLANVLQMPPPPPPPPLPPMETNLNTAIPSSTVPSAASTNNKEKDGKSSQIAYMDQLKQIMEGGIALKKTQRPEKKPDIHEANKFSIDVKLRTTRKSESPPENKENSSEDKEASQNESFVNRLRKSPKSNTTETSCEPLADKDNLLSQLTEIRQKMKKVQKVEKDIPESTTTIEEVFQTNIETRTKCPPRPNVTPKLARQESVCDTYERDKPEKTTKLKSRRHSFYSVQDKSTVPSKPMEDHIKNFFKKKQAKSEVEIQIEKPVALEKVDAQVHFSEAQVETKSAEEESIAANVTCSEKGGPHEVRATPNEVINTEVTVVLPMEDNLVATEAIDTTPKVNNGNGTLEPPTTSPATLPKPKTKPKLDVPKPEEKVETKSDPSPTHVPPPPPPLPQASTTKTVVTASCSSKSTKEVTVSDSGSKQTTTSYSYSATSSMTSNGGADNSELLSAIKGFNKSFLKKVRENEDGCKKTKKDALGIGNELAAQINKAIQSRFSAMHGEDSDSENYEDSEWETNEQWEE